HYGSYEPVEARKMFIEHALVRGEWPAMPQFLEKNLALIEEIREQEARLRRPDLLGDESQLFGFYDARVPADVCTAAALKSWLRRVDGPQLAGRALRMQQADALRAGASTDVKSQFPDHLDISGHSIALSYTHDPGAEADGVSFQVTLPLLFALDAHAFDWLVPGLRAAKIEGLIRTLPNQLRRQCSPIPEYAAALANSLEPRGPLLPALCARFKEMTGVELVLSDFDPAKLEPHLKPRLVLSGADGKPIAEAGTLIELQQRFAGSARDAINRVAEEDDVAARWTREGLRDWDFGALPEAVTLQGGVLAYPGLAARADSIALQLFESAPARARESHAGVRALLLAKMPERLREIEKKARTQFALRLPALGITAEALARQLAERVADTLLTGPVTDAAGFQRALEGRAGFSVEAQKRLDAIGTWLQHAGEIRKRIDSLGRPEAQADLRAQLEQMFAPGFVAWIPEAQWPRIAVYLRAINIRLDRLPNKPQRDLELTAQLRPWLQKLPGPFHPGRWVIEEWRVALFAQELKALGSPSAERVALTLAEPSK
ncbi:MAG TPA: DUF3418 domain-containing protein, partial [Solimonas sp.]|nr:DUF3418 domain-containing protein [Solimonas sp.]